jgi:hypothetical protein
LSSYYFVTASLPMLQYDRPAGITRAYFLDLCRAHLTPHDFILLERALIFDFTEREPCPAAYGRYRTWETALRNELVLLRAAKTGKEAARYLKEGEGVSGMRAIARRIFDEASPLQAEELTDRARWQYLEDLELGHFFDLSKLVVYYLKLQLLERKAFFKEQEGQETFSALEQRVFEELKAGVEAYGT